jgi:hypothetical protein
MSHFEATDWTADIRQEDLRGLALILEYANEQAQKLALADTTSLITRASRSLEARLADDLHTGATEDTPDDYATGIRLADEDADAWQTPEFLGGPIVFDDVA